jgi:hypothetical protein
MDTSRTDIRTDFTVVDEGSIVLLYPRTDEAKAWVEEHIGPDNGFQPYYPGKIIIEHRYAIDVINGFQADGLTVELA